METGSSDVMNMEIGGRGILIRKRRRRKICSKVVRFLLLRKFVNAKIFSCSGT